MLTREAVLEDIKDTAIATACGFGATIPAWYLLGSHVGKAAVQLAEGEGRMVSRDLPRQLARAYVRRLPVPFGLQVGLTEGLFLSLRHVPGWTDARDRRAHDYTLCATAAALVTGCPLVQVKDIGHFALRIRHPLWTNALLWSSSCVLLALFAPSDAHFDFYAPRPPPQRVPSLGAHY